jgi:hypothetical protein
MHNTIAPSNELDVDRIVSFDALALFAVPVKTVWNVFLGYESWCTVH